MITLSPLSANTKQQMNTSPSSCTFTFDPIVYIGFKQSVSMFFDENEKSGVLFGL